jgi:hypothetical protein
VDVSVIVPNVGPALGISTKSTSGAFRNLTNRMEEAPGECANIHMMYPGFVFGFLHLIRFARVSDGVTVQNASFQPDNSPSKALERFHNVLSTLAGRSMITDPEFRYEAIAMLVYRCNGQGAEIWPHYPPPTSPIHFSKFFPRLYELYDLRFSYPNPKSDNVRKLWRLKDLESKPEYDSLSGFPWDTRIEAGEYEDVEKQDEAISEE